MYNTGRAAPASTAAAQLPDGNLFADISNLVASPCVTNHTWSCNIRGGTVIRISAIQLAFPVLMCRRIIAAHGSYETMTE